MCDTLNRRLDEQFKLPSQSEEALALNFSEPYAHELRYVAAWGKWLTWDGQLWRSDDTLAVYDRARGICRSAAIDTDAKDSTASKIAAANTVSAVERLARADRRHAGTVSQWDSDPWLLNTPKGVVDLRTGIIRPATREDYATKITAAAPCGDCPMWRQFLSCVTANDEALQRFLQRMCGYALTGSTREHALFFLYGKGANGKSTFLGSIAGVLGHYAKTAPIEAFIASTNDHHPTDLAGLQGARLVTAVETEDGRRWAENKLKALTGGDRIAARFMRQDFFEFAPQFKLVVAGNHRPGLRTVDEAMRRRFNLIPFTVTIPESERDAELTDRLRAEWGGILRWMIDGCLDWQEGGLSAPETIRNATNEYLAAEDSIGRWMEECCILRETWWTSSTALFNSWMNWCQTTGERPGSQRRFTQALEGRGFVLQRTDRARGFAGIGLREDG
jgi:putative DNA primase/helicase